MLSHIILGNWDQAEEWYCEEEAADNGQNSDFIDTFYTTFCLHFHCLTSKYKIVPVDNLIFFIFLPYPWGQVIKSVKCAFVFYLLGINYWSP